MKRIHGRIKTKSDSDTDNEQYFYDNHQKINGKEGRRVMENAFMARMHYMPLATAFEKLCRLTAFWFGEHL